MKKEDLFEAMEGIDARYVEEGREEPAKKPGSWDKWVRFTVAAAAVLVLAGAGALYFAKNPLSPKVKAPIEKHVKPDEPAKDIPEIYKVPHWEDMKDVQRFSSFLLDGKEYRTMLILVHPENVGEALGTGTLRGQDLYTDEVHTADETAYAVKGISTDAAVCVCMPSEPDRAYAYVNASWRPETLGAFIGQLSLRETMKTGLVYTDRGPDPDIVYEDVATEKVWEMLLSGAEDTVNEGPDLTVGKRILSIAVRVDLLGNHYKTFTLTEDGYLMTNLLETGKYFRIGRERIDAFVKEVTENHQGYIYIYDTPTGEVGIPE